MIGTFIKPFFGKFFDLHQKFNVYPVKMFWRTACIFLIYFTTFQTTHAQFVEVGFNLAGMTYQGDISPLRYRFSFQGAKFAYGVNLGYHISNHISCRLSYNHGSIAAADKYAVDPWRKKRNLNFRTDISEWSLTTDFF